MNPFSPRYALLALVLAFLLWGVAQSASPIERAYDLPVVTEAVPAHLVVVRQDFERVNVRVRGSRAALSSISEADLSYPVDLSSASAGRIRFDVDLSLIASRLPLGAEIVSRSPLSIGYELERKQTRAVPVRAELEGEPAPGHRVKSVRMRPARISLTGARSDILGLRAIATEPIDISGITQSLVRPVLLPMAERRGWLETYEQVEVYIEIEATDTAAENADGLNEEGAL